MAVGGGQSGRRWLWVGVAVATAGAAGALIAVWLVPPAVYRPADQADARASLQSGLLTAAAAMVAVVGGLVALAETRRSNENTHVRELYSLAVTQLGADDETIRLGGIFALERIATDSPADQRTVVAVLSAFIRRRSADPALRAPTPPADAGAGRGTQDDGVAPVRFAADLRAAVQVLARLPERRGVDRADLNGADLTGPASLAGLRLDYANLAGVWLADADLTGARLEGANLAGAMLARADLSRAALLVANLAGARLSGADLRGARLGGAKLTAWPDRYTFIRVRLDDAILIGATLQGADLTGVEGLTQEQINSSLGNDRTRLPVDLHRPRSWD
ncbi:pentapeptide repeat-containing protein [Frankia sp. QA3]|uniref:pentapeptide repeat-containing protein n=1 Tax=Frankia sp. QA3 TaxID=710111 RepID=UPI000269CF74|nr:pentapeptide repeat-containing protein [Frankia sp. QA3]EIV96345.1 putative low-complexity protein [Frankia sp. QA3]